MGTARKDITISPIALVRRRLNGVRTVSSGEVNRPIPQAEFSATCRRYQQEAAEQLSSMPEVVNGLWKSEGFATTFGKYRLPDNTLNDPRIPRESLGIVHVGYGAASNEHAHFDTEKLRETFETKCQPDYRGFAIEGTGSTLRIYEPGLFKFMCGVLGLIPRNAPPGPDKDGFFASYLSAFSPEEQRLIVHGYGRLVAFSRFSIHKALREAGGLPAERVQPCVQGIGFAYAMMNSPDMARLLDHSDIPYPPPVRAAFQSGLIYGMVFCDWFAPGFLGAWQAQGRLEEKLIELARAEAALNQKRGHILPFALENPPSA